MGHRARYQFTDADLIAIGGLASSDSNFIVGSASGWVAESGATARTSLGLGTGDSPTFTGITTSGTGTIGSGLTVNADNVAQRHLTLEGYGVGGASSRRGGSIEWYEDGSTVGGYTFTNLNSEFVWKGTAQNSAGDTGVAYIDFDTGDAGFNGDVEIGGDLNVNSITPDSGTLTLSEITLMEDTLELWMDMESTSGNERGLWPIVDIQPASASSADLYALEGNLRIYPAGGATSSNLTGIIATMHYMLTGWWTYTGTIDDTRLAWLEYRGDADFAGTITDAYGLLIDGMAMATTFENGTVTNAYGLKIEDVSGADTLNYAIYTGTGAIRFGDNIELHNTAECRFYDNGNYVGFEAPALSADQIWVLPPADGGTDEIIKTNGSGVFSFVRMPKAIYAELSDNADQTFAVAGTHYSITFNTNDEIAGITHSTSVDPENITIDTTGVYTIFAQPQVAAAAGGAGTFHMWLQNNTGSGFVDIANTNIELSLASAKEDVIPLATTFLLTAGDIIRLRVNVSDNGIKLDAQAAIVGPPTEPAIPSIIFTMFMIGT